VLNEALAAVNDPDIPALVNALTVVNSASSESIKAPAAVTTVRALTKAGISGSFTAASASFSTRVTANDAKVSYTDAAVTSVINTAGVISSSAQFGSSDNVTFGTIEATSLNVTSITSSIVTSSIVQTEGSNIFGDAISDTQTFNGHITASGNISASGTISGQVGLIRHNITSDTATDAKGDVVYFGSGDGLDAGKIHHYKPLLVATAVAFAISQDPSDL
jgi:hypothetical protein